MNIAKFNSSRILALLHRYRHFNLALADQVMVSGANFLTGILLARFLGISGFGEYTLVWSLFLFAYSLQEAFIIVPAMSIAPKLEGEERRLVFGSVLLHALLYAVSIAALLSGFMWLGDLAGLHSGKFAIPLFFAALARLLQDMLRRYFYINDRQRVVLMGDAITYLGQLGLIYWFIGNGSAEASHAVSIMGVAAFAGILFVLPFLPRLTFEKAAFREWLKRSWRSSRWLSLSEILEWAGSYSFFAIAAAFLGTTAVGALRASQNIVALGNVIIFGLGNVLPVRAAQRFVQQGVSGLDHFVRNVRYIVLAIVLAVFAIAAAAPGFWLETLYGPEYMGYGYVVVCTGVWSIVVALGIPLRIWLQTAENTHPVFLSYLGSLIAVGVVATPLTWAFGLPGLLVGIVICAAIAIGVMWRGVISIRGELKAAESRP